MKNLSEQSKTRVGTHIYMQYRSIVPFYFVISLPRCVKKMDFFLMLYCERKRELGDESFVQLIQAMVQIGAIEIAPSWFHADFKQCLSFCGE